MEIEAVVGAVVELGERLGLQLPATRAVYACVKLLDERRTGSRLLALGSGRDAPKANSREPRAAL
jgi:hypothetical protein